MLSVTIATYLIEINYKIKSVFIIDTRTPLITFFRFECIHGIYI